MKITDVRAHHISIPYDAGVASFKQGASAIAALDIGADAVFALPVETTRVIAKVLSYRALPLTTPIGSTISVGSSTR